MNEELFPVGDFPVDATAASHAPGTISPDQVRIALRRVKDPDLNLSIVDLGLVYDIRIEGTDVQVDVSLTSPGCPSGPEIMGDCKRSSRHSTESAPQA